MQQPPLSVFRINQEGYAAGLPVRIAFTGEGPLCLKDSGGQVIRRLAPERAPVDPASGDRVALVDRGCRVCGSLLQRAAG